MAQYIPVLYTPVLFVISFALFLALGTPKVLLLTLPPLVYCILRYHPKATAVAFIAALAWLLLLLGLGRMSGVSGRIYLTGWAKGFFAAVGVGAGGAAILFFWKIGELDTQSLYGFISLAAIFAGVSCICYSLAQLLARHLVCPLLVLQSERCTALLSDYGALSGNGTYYTLRFEGDPEEYVVSRILFQRLRGHVCQSVSYTRCSCLLGLTAIRGVRLLEKEAGLPSSWEESYQLPAARRRRRNGMMAFLIVFLLVGATVMLLLFK